MYDQLYVGSINCVCISIVTGPRVLTVQGRELRLEKTCGNIADCTFKELCDRVSYFHNYLLYHSLYFFCIYLPLSFSQLRLSPACYCISLFSVLTMLCYFFSSNQIPLFFLILSLSFYPHSRLRSIVPVFLIYPLILFPDVFFYLLHCVLPLCFCLFFFYSFLLILIPSALVLAPSCPLQFYINSSVRCSRSKTTGYF